MAVVESPCTKVCAIDQVSGLCRGCLRTLDEIARWGVADDGERRAILAKVAERERRYQAASPAKAGVQPLRRR